MEFVVGDNKLHIRRYLTKVKITLISNLKSEFINLFKSEIYSNIKRMLDFCAYKINNSVKFYFKKNGKIWQKSENTILIEF
jgi:hypothetical protein